MSNTTLIEKAIEILQRLYKIYADKPKRTEYQTGLMVAYGRTIRLLHLLLLKSTKKEFDDYVNQLLNQEQR